MQTAERISPTDLSDNVIYQRHRIAYEEAKKYIKGNVLEIGCGEGYGIAMLAPLADQYSAIDKYEVNFPDEKPYTDVKIYYQSIPPIKEFSDNSVDVIITFQVIEHIEDDKSFISEIARVLKPGGQLILTTPNKKMSLTRNPWHVREYVHPELEVLIKRHFTTVEVKGVFGHKKVMNYYEENKSSVRKFTRFDIFNLQYRLPRSLLQIPYDILNRINRKMLLDGSNKLVSDIKMEDHYIDEFNDSAFDFFIVANR